MSTMSNSRRLPKSQLWYPLDNAAKLYSAIKSKEWTSGYRYAMILDQPIDASRLQKALDKTLPRFPTFATRLRRGLFWYYFEPNKAKPHVEADVRNPCMRFHRKEDDGFLFRIRYYENRIALEAYHCLTDGTGALCFFKTLVAQYLGLGGHKIPCTHDVLDIRQMPDPKESEDGYSTYARFQGKMRGEDTLAWQVPGTQEPATTLHIITALIPVDKLLAVAKSYHVTLSEFLVAVYLQTLLRVQSEQPLLKKRPVRVQVPVNLRKYYPTKTLRNFLLFVVPSIDPTFGDFTFEEILTQVHHFMRLECSEKFLNANMGRNVRFEQNPVLRALPLFIKNELMKAAFMFMGDSRYSSTMTNMGPVQLPDEMTKHVKRIDVMLGPARKNRVNCAMISYNNILSLTTTRNIRETRVDRLFYTSLVKFGIPVKLESNHES